MNNVGEDVLNQFRILGDEQANNGNFIEAIEYYKKCIEIDPKSTIMYNRVGHLYEKIDEWEYIEEQIKYFEKALELDPNYSLTIRNLAFVYFKAGKYEESFELFHKLLNNNPLTDDYVAYACRKIQLGDFEEGWKYYEYRFLKTCGVTEYPEINKPRWEGNIKSNTLLVQSEQGFGDSIQFLRYLEWAKPFFGKIIFRVQEELVELFKINVENIDIVGSNTSIDDLSFDYHIPLMSLPYVLNARIDNIPLSQGYIKADKNRSDFYKHHFFDNDCLKIGITWKGMAFGNKRRNVPLRTFYELAKLKNVKLYSFQKDFSPSEIENVPKEVEIVNLGQTFLNFSDTAAAMENIDLFVTSDNSVFNLAGAMGKKTFVLLNRLSEWRWFLDEDKTPWYDSVKIFKKQNENDDWSLLMKRVIDTIEENIVRTN